MRELDPVGAEPPIVQALSARASAIARRVRADERRRREARLRNDAFRVVSHALTARIALDLDDYVTAAAHARSAAALAAHVADTLTPDPQEP